MKKGQTATNFLFTYGWAILVILVVVVALYAMGIFNPQDTVDHTTCEYVCAFKRLEYGNEYQNTCVCLDCEEFTDEGVEYRACVEKEFKIQEIEVKI